LSHSRAPLAPRTVFLVISQAICLIFQQLTRPVAVRWSPALPLLKPRCWDGLL